MLPTMNWGYYLAAIFRKPSLEMQRSSDLYEAQITLMEAEKNVEYFSAITTAMRGRVARLKREGERNEIQ